MNRSAMALATGAGLLAAVVAAGLVWSLAGAYLSRHGGDTTIDAPVFDRTNLVRDLAVAGYELGDEAHVRIYKREHLLELWVRGADTRFALFRTYEICRYSGALGPKLAEGDRQAPEGFYRVAKAQLNPHSRHHLAFNIGFPNAFDKSLGRTGSFLMVHGGCTSVGCYAMTDRQIDEIYAVIEAALEGGQREIDVSIFPFRMSETALQAEGRSRWSGFWRNLKEGADLFESTGVPPRVSVCRGTYVFGGTTLGDECAPITGWV